MEQIANTEIRLLSLIPMAGFAIGIFTSGLYWILGLSKYMRSGHSKSKEFIPLLAWGGALFLSVGMFFLFRTLLFMFPASNIEGNEQWILFIDKFVRTLPVLIVIVGMWYSRFLFGNFVVHKSKNLFTNDNRSIVASIITSIGGVFILSFF